jgi:hypothetical protein
LLLLFLILYGITITGLNHILLLLQKEKEQNMETQNAKGPSRRKDEVSVIVVVSQRTHIIIVRPAPSTHFQHDHLPGGFVQSGEEYRAAAVRHLQKKLNLHIPPRVKLMPIPYQESSRRGGTHVFLICIGINTFPTILPGGISAKWVRIGELLDIQESPALYPMHRKAIISAARYLPQPVSVQTATAAR